MRNEMRDVSMKDQKVYLISKQEDRVALPLLIAIELSERLEEFVRNLMKLRAVLRTSLLLLLELKAYPVNCLTPILHVVVKFCKAKVALDGVRFQVNNFMSTTEEKAYWTTFLWRWLDSSAALLQVAKDLGIQSLIQVIYLVHEPSCSAILKPATFDFSFEERRLLLTRASLASRFGARKLRSPGHQLVRTASYAAVEDAAEAKFRNQQHCMPGVAFVQRFGGLASLILGNFACHRSSNSLPRTRESPESQIQTAQDMEQLEDESSYDTQKTVMSLSELMRLESVVETVNNTVNNADELQDIVSRLSVADKFDKCILSEHGNLYGREHDQIVKAHKLSTSWSYTAYSNRSPTKGSSEKKEVRFHVSPQVKEEKVPCNMTPKVKKEVRFHISPEEGFVDAENAELEDSTPKNEDADSTSTTTSKCTEPDLETSICTLDAKPAAADETSYVSLGIKKGKKQKLFGGLKAAAKTFGLGNKKTHLWGTKCPKNSSQHLYITTVSH